MDSQAGRLLKRWKNKPDKAKAESVLMNLLSGSFSELLNWYQYTDTLPVRPTIKQVLEAYKNRRVLEKLSAKEEAEMADAEEWHKHWENHPGR